LNLTTPRRFWRDISDQISAIRNQDSFKTGGAPGCSFMFVTIHVILLNLNICRPRRSPFSVSKYGEIPWISYWPVTNYPLCFPRKSDLDLFRRSGAPQVLSRRTLRKGLEDGMPAISRDSWPLRAAHFANWKHTSSLPVAWVISRALPQIQPFSKSTALRRCCTECASA